MSVLLKQSTRGGYLNILKLEPARVILTVKKL